MERLSGSFPRRGAHLSLKSISVFVLWLAASMLSAPPAEAVPIISIGPSPTVVHIGDTFTLDVLIGETDPGPSDDVADLFAYQFSVSYDPSLLSATSVSEGSFLSSAGPTFFIPGVIDDVAGLITFSAATLLGPIAGASGSGSLLRIEFTALALGTSAVTPLFDALSGDGLLDSALQPIEPVSIEAGRVTVAPAPVPEPGMLLLLGVGFAALCARRRASTQPSDSYNDWVPAVSQRRMFMCRDSTPEPSRLAYVRGCREEKWISIGRETARSAD
jgi:hypothetical protein